LLIDTQPNWQPNITTVRVGLGLGLNPYLVTLLIETQPNWQPNITTNITTVRVGLGLGLGLNPNLVTLLIETQPNWQPNITTVRVGRFKSMGLKSRFKSIDFFTGFFIFFKSSDLSDAKTMQNILDRK